MKQYLLFALGSISLIVFATAFVDRDKDHSAKHLEIVIRNIGHEVLLHSHDSTSRVMPIEAVDKNTFRISFESSFSFKPDALKKVVREQLARTDSPADYAVSVNDCEKNVTVFAYEVSSSDGDVKACQGRQYSKGCYLIEISFPAKKSFNYAWLLLALIPVGFGGAYLAGKGKAQAPELVGMKVDEFVPVVADSRMVGSFEFFESKGILSLNGEAVELSANEVKALSILSANQNQVVERDLLMKKIWEDEGVLVITRNVDVLISKLRKRLGADPSVKILTVHGKGYKMVA